MGMLLGYGYWLTGNEIRPANDRNHLNANEKDRKERFAEIAGLTGSIAGLGFREGLNRGFFDSKYIEF
jgi:hypothetical protein